ncbi:biopolymer transporter TonB [Kaistia sp. 32K]|uniref:energy transducer TonB n=1 Tax=Kaistia sp. 32K TaxID=2795690 RepID=UPI0019158FE5|nr:energy transducer TonB [Kaistia sp. 32K]BCP52134.1 biopolymer transporter TonB [Kaistia sp. 32K]
MTDWSRSIGRGARIGETVLWAGAGLVVLGAHVGAAAWLMREPPITAADSSPPPAIMIELAPEPEAVVTDKTEISPDPELAAEIAPNMAEPIEEPTPEELQPVEEKVVEAAQPQEIAEATVEPVEETAAVEPLDDEIEPVEEAVTEAETVAVPLPAPRPKPPVTRVAEAKPPKEQTREKVKEPAKETAKKPPRPAPSAASRASNEAAAEVRQSNRTAARQSMTGLFSASMSPARWQSRLMAHLERRKRYPAGARSRGETGIVTVHFTVDDGGNVLSVALARSSGFPDLDEEVLSLVKRASPVPPPPPGANKTITAPVRFKL